MLIIREKLEIKKKTTSQDILIMAFDKFKSLKKKKVVPAFAYSLLFGQIRTFYKRAIRSGFSKLKNYLPQPKDENKENYDPNLIEKHILANQVKKIYAFVNV